MHTEPQENYLFMTSFDVDSLFTNIPLNETIDICVNKLYTHNNLKANGIGKQEFRSLLCQPRNLCLCLTNITIDKQTG